MENNYYYFFMEKNHYYYFFYGEKPWDTFFKMWVSGLITYK